MAASIPTAEPLAFSAHEAERRYRIDRGLICRAIRQGKLPAQRPGRRRYLIFRRDLEQWLRREFAVTPTEVPTPDLSPCDLPPNVRKAVERRASIEET